MNTKLVPIIPEWYEQKTKTIKIGDKITSIRLENFVWDIIIQISEEEQKDLGEFLNDMHEFVAASKIEISNFASFLRVTSMRYLQRKTIQQERFLEQIALITNSYQL
jgi:predicted DNA-binding ribbon-helix-helix protein